MATLEKCLITDEEVVKFNKVTNESYCSVCPTETITGTWENHVKSAAHILTLERFNFIFELHGKEVYCKYCNADFTLEMLSTHGKAHIIISGYNFKNVYETFFENCIIWCKNQFYCCSCKVTCRDSHIVLCHIGNLPHQSLNKDTSLLTKETVLMPGGIDHELLVFEGLILVNSTTLECHVCNKIIIELANVLEHIEGFHHEYYRLRFSPEQLEKMNDLIVPKVPNELPLVDSVTQEFSNDSNINDQELTGKTLFPNYIGKLDKTYSYCMICCCKFVSHETDNHIAENDHKDALKRYGCDNISSTGESSYYCKYCDRAIIGRDNLYLHIMGKKHSNSLLKPRQKAIPETGEPETEKRPDNLEMITKSVIVESETVKRPDKLEMMTTQDKLRSLKKSEAREPATKIPETVDDNLLTFVTTKCITRENATDFSCKMCDTKILNLTEIEVHLTGIEHEMSLKKYSTENIVCIDGNSYYCKCCSCRISGFDNVCHHLRGKRHCFNMVTTTQQEVEVIAKRPESQSMRRSELSTFFEKSQAQDLKKSDKLYRLRNIITEKSIVETQQISCNFCTAALTNSAELHSHLANHLSHEFVHSTIDQNANATLTDYSNTVGNTANSESLNKVPENYDSIDNTKMLKNQDNRGNSLNGTLDDNNMNYMSSKFSKPSINLDNETSDSENEFSSESIDLEEQRRSLKETTMKKIIRNLDFDKDYIYNLRDKLRSIELGMKLCFINGSKNIYCLVCRKTVANSLQNYFEHLCSLNHTSSLEAIEKDHARFAPVKGQFSELHLAYQYMEETSIDNVRCLICDMDVENIDYVLQHHIDDKNHEMIDKKMHINAEQNFDNVKGRMQCDWYNVQKYWCVPCSVNFGSEVKFVRHLESAQHKFVMGKWENIDRKLIYDFCPSCALLWYGYRCTYAYHCDLPSHKWLVQDGYYLSPNLPEMAKTLLANPEKYVNGTIEYLKEASAREREKEQTLLDDLEKAVRKKFFNSKAYTFGSRVSGLGSTNSDIDVFLDCGDMYNGKIVSKNDMVHLMLEVHECLKNDMQTWDVNEFLINCRSRIVKTHHRATGLLCDISLENGLSVENTKLIKSINDIFPPCRNLILFLRQWLACCDLSGSEQITSYAICWYVIFYLQKESILPSITTLIAMKKESHMIAGWEVGVSHDFTYNKAESNINFNEFLIRFFTFYANFDFRHDVACPLLGDILKKRTFADTEMLPNEMTPYIDYMRNSDDSQPLRIDSAMCIQDPFNLCDNLTEAVSKVFLRRFRTYCSQSLDVLGSA